MTEEKDQSIRKKPTEKLWLRRILLFVVPCLVVLGSATAYMLGGRYVETDNAYVQSDINRINTEISGPIEQVAVKENQTVHAGQVLFVIDAAPFKLAEAKANAQLQQVKLDILEQQAAYQEKQAEIAQAENTYAFNQREEQRQANLLKQKFISDTQFDQAKQAAEVSRLQVATLKKDLYRLKEALGGNPTAPLEDHPSYQSALAALNQSRIDLNHVEVRAPVSGVVAKVPNQGEYMTKGAIAMVLVADKEKWIEANFTEKDLTHVQVGQTVAIEVDAFPDTTLHGKVESISPATGAEFSVIPAENATGNWVKIAQRLAVKIQFDQGQSIPELRTGLSSTVTIDTTYHRQLLGMTL
ncbi:HlyD family secretion protein [Marinomonas sp. TW1]|uniref:HlyD family secretion protein n=1 Tax=Marinomonas sp. TW1 TaxID=1561203 RepID=UPI0007AF8729|nr:HlyD family secretion protein [Marinomonas sp. TW1]KZN14362.1 hemolysin D [Marinomonas sp. TW1]